MDLKNLDSIINRYTPNLSVSARNSIAAIGMEMKLARGMDLFSLNTSNQYEYMLLKGIARTFLINTDGDEITLSFFEDNTILPPFVTRTRDGRSLLFCDAVTDCEFFCLQAHEFESLMVDNLEVRDFGNTVLRHELLNKVQKEIRMASWTAKERLQQFRKDFRMLENYVPHTMIASYLGITNVSLSRLRQQT